MTASLRSAALHCSLLQCPLEATLRAAIGYRSATAHTSLQIPRSMSRGRIMSPIPWFYVPRRDRQCLLVGSDSLSGAVQACLSGATVFSIGGPGATCQASCRSAESDLCCSASGLALSLSASVQDQSSLLSCDAADAAQMSKNFGAPMPDCLAHSLPLVLHCMIKTTLCCSLAGQLLLWLHEPGGCLHAMHGLLGRSLSSLHCGAAWAGALAQYHDEHCHMTWG